MLSTFGALQNKWDMFRAIGWGCQGGHIYGANNENGQREGRQWLVTMSYASDFKCKLPKLGSLLTI